MGFPMKRDIVLIIPHTHWDRAWYVPYEVYRHKLIPLMDKAISLLEDHDDLRFTGDGQTAMILDYLEIRPEMRERVEKLVRSGKLAVGPWYILPDEFLVGGEALIRNLEMGRADAVALGCVMRAGLMPDSFGHVAQLPQILLGFDIDSLIFSRGLHEEEAPAEFEWRGPDGSSVLGLFQVGGYFNGANLGYPGGCDTEWVRYEEKAALDKVKELIGRHAGRAPSGVTLVHNGMDHLEMQQELPELLKAARSKLPTYDIQIATYGEAVHTIREQQAARPLELIEGELTYPHGGMLKGVHSSRVSLKQANQRCEDLLTMVAEPLEALAYLVKPGRGDEVSLLRHAWRELLKNQPHDDICGCSCDAVHRENMTRFQSVQTLLETIARDALRDVAHAVNRNDLEGLPLVVYHPPPYRASGTVTLEVEITRKEWAKLRRGFRVLSHAGKELPHFLVKTERFVRAEVRNTYDRIRLTIEVLGLECSPMGFQLVTLVPGSPKSTIDPVVKVLDDGLENEDVCLRVTKEGTLDLYHKGSGVTFRGLNLLRDEGDRGDSYNWCPIEGEEPIHPEPPADKPVITCNGLSGSIRWKQKLSIPRSLGRDGKSRAHRRIALPIQFEVRIRAGSSRVDIRLTVENKALDHRLRVAFPLPVKVDKISVGSAFASVTREVNMREHVGYRPKKEATYCPTENFQRHLTIMNDRVGIAILARGISEYESIAVKGGTTILLTLLRATGWLSRDDLSTRPGLAGPPIETPGGQMPGLHVLEYAIQPFSPEEGNNFVHASLEYTSAPIVERGDFDATPQWLKEEKHKLPVPKDGPLGRDFHLVSSPDTRIVFTAFRRLEGNVCETRFYNHSPSQCSTSIEYGLTVSDIHQCRMNGELTREMGDTNPVPVDLKPWEIVTLRFRIH